MNAPLNSPCEAGFSLETSISRTLRKKVCMLAYACYEFDNRIRRYAEALAARGDQVDVIALAEGNSPLRTEVVKGVTVYRVQQRSFNERHKWTYAWRLLRFLWASSIFLTRRHRRVRYDVIHVHNVPDFMIFAAWYPKWKGAKLILDIHDIMPELFANKFQTKTRNGYVRLLKAIEKASTGFADHVIISNHLWYETITARSVSRQKTSVFLNHVDPAIFYRRARTRNDGKFIILFPGSFQWHQGLDIAIQALAKVKEQLPHAELHFYGGGGGTEGGLKQLAEQVGVGESVKFFGSRSIEQIADVMANADLGVVPKRANSFGNEAYSTKIMEFMSQGVPVAVSKTKIDSYYFDDTVVRFFPSGDVGALAEAIVSLATDQRLRAQLIAAGYEYVRQNSWGTKKADYLGLMDSLSSNESLRDEDGG
jgi:glycosyltransferase involved in cell wall biosynthesis